MERATVISNELEGAESDRVLSGSSCKPRGWCAAFEFRFWLVTVFALSLYFIAASINSGWIFLISSSLFLILLCSVILPCLTLSSIRLTNAAPDSVTAGDELSVAVNITPYRRLFPACDLIIRARNMGSSGSPANFSRSVVLDDARKQSSALLNLASVKRGLWYLPEVLVETSYPFGVCWIGRNFAPTRKIFVLPRVHAMEGRFLYQIKSSHYVPGSGRLTSTSGFQSSAGKGVREYVRGDNRRFINWALSARHNKLMVKEFDREGLAVFDLAIATFAFWESEEQFELAVTACASLAKFGHDQGVHPQLHVLDRAVDSTGLPAHTLELEEQLRQLAAVQKPASGEKLWYNGLEYLSGRSRALVLIVPDSGKLYGGLEFIPQGVTLLAIKTVQPSPKQSAGASDPGQSSLFCLSSEAELATL